MKQEEFIQKTMIALMSNPNVTNAYNFDDDLHHLRIHDAALYLSNTKDEKGECVMSFDDVNSNEAETFPDCVSERECLHQIGIALQAIANNKTMKEELMDSAGNFERYEMD
ncbi:MAG: hypothetical protein IKB96_06215 [Prevotella sp.]|nr:hypothetical protein [Prevotella sp.]